MGINKNNYEAYLLDLWEGTLSEADKVVLYQFLAEHPELDENEALNILENVAITDTHTLFDKASISFDHINLKNFEFFFIAYSEGDLSKEEMNAVDDFIKEHPALNKKFEQFEQAKLPVETIIYPNKRKLLIGTAPVISIQTRRLFIGIAAASVVFLFLIVSPFKNVQYKYTMTPNVNVEIDKYTSDSVKEKTIKPVTISIAVESEIKRTNQLSLPTSKKEGKSNQNQIKYKDINHPIPSKNKDFNAASNPKELAVIEETEAKDVPTEFAPSLPAEIMEEETLADYSFQEKEEVPTILDLAASYLQRKNFINEERKPDFKGIINTTFAKANDNKEPVLASSEESNVKRTSFQLGVFKVERIVNK